jgi:hypothetical protein
LFSPGSPVSSSNKTDHHDITEILLQVALSIIKRNQTELLMKTTYVLYAIGHNMYYSVGNGEDISTLNNRCQILLLFHDNKNMFVDCVIMSVPGLPGGPIFLPNVFTMDFCLCDAIKKNSNFQSMYACVGLLDLPPSGPKYEASYLN